MLIIGLGNPGLKYKNTFHNMGFLTIDCLAEKLNKSLSKKECEAKITVFDKNGQKIILAKPQTFMNNSGVAVKQLMAKYKQSPADLIIIYDDIDIPKFSVRARNNGSAGTHNGMKSIVSTINSTDFKRIRIGIGHENLDLISFVLSKISSEEQKSYSEIFEKLSLFISDYILDNDFEKLMREANGIK